jgi:MoaA/NifB/PqqE/SkfB family radical SAM enzyme
MMGLDVMTDLKKLYVEPTSRCNLRCRTCIRNAWDEPLGRMRKATFARILEGLRAISPPPDIFFGGYGEPLSHPRIVEMVAATAALGGRVELITNATLLTPEMSRRLIAAGLFRLWVSLDGARPESYADVRLGAALPAVLANLAAFRAARRVSHWSLPEIGIAFVAMQRNIADLPELMRLGRHLGATRFMVTNLLPHTEEMRAEILYGRALSEISYIPSPIVPHVNLAKMDINETTGGVLYDVLRSNRNVTFAGSDLSGSSDRCPFIEQGAAVVGWDGGFSPCLPLLHSYTSFLDHRKRHSRCYTVGDIAERDLGALWGNAGHRAFRERVRRFDFAPCTFCGGCELSYANEEDCYGNGFPTCGGCLWAQGIIQCP